ncbi:MAG: hypothetical protein EP307_06305 [Rhodobacteraceae bacterium]|nr:MAG: hypothetical protein EP307_06305 [Paracoccaceae bacterium]
MDAILSEMMTTFLLPAAALFGAGAALLMVLRWLLMRFAPRWMVGPNGFLIDTTGGLGIFQMRDTQMMDYQRRTDAASGGSDHGPIC